MSPVRKASEPAVIPSEAQGRGQGRTTEAQEVFVYLTDSSEINKIRTPVPAGATVQLRCGFSRRELTLEEVKTFRNAGTLPKGAGASPLSVSCTIISPLEEIFRPEPLAHSDGVYSAHLVMTLTGGWKYAFSGTGGFVGDGERAIDVVARQKG